MKKGNGTDSLKKKKKKKQPEPATFRMVGEPSSDSYGGCFATIPKLIIYC